MMRKLLPVLPLLFVVSIVEAGNDASEAQVKEAFKTLIKNQNVKLSKSELCNPTGSDANKTIGDLLASTLSYAIAEKGHETNLHTRCENVNLKEKGKVKNLLDCEMSIYMKTREGASSSFRFAIDTRDNSLIKDSIRCF
ncbi:MAG: hypothetical protein OEY52_10500 [Gammaproteobacteria bacterium]|nr:hypothetical protein [Gammaproteobacteria bacterium]